VFLNGFNFVELFGKSLTRQNGDDTAAALLELYQEKEKTFELLTYAIQAEVNKTSMTFTQRLLFGINPFSFTEEPSTLFRSEELPSRLIRVFQKRVGSEYLKQTLGPFIENVAKSNILLEVSRNGVILLFNRDSKQSFRSILIV